MQRSPQQKLFSFYLFSRDHCRAPAGRFGFTLIELLIVVAIIAILAAIAVPNFLEAQTRAKVSRAQADLRSLATALESYAVDNVNEYPAYGNPRDAAIAGDESVTFVPVMLTTPIAYISSLPGDAFPGKREGVDPFPGPPTYFYKHDYETTYQGEFQPAGHIEEHYFELTGAEREVKWVLWSFGPNMEDEHGEDYYDPTNGTVSRGDLMRFGP